LLNLLSFDSAKLNKIRELTKRIWKKFADFNTF